METLMKLVTRDQQALLEDGTVSAEGWVMGTPQLRGKQEWTLPTAGRVEGCGAWELGVWVRHQQSWEDECLPVMQGLECHRQEPRFVWSTVENDWGVLSSGETLMDKVEQM